MKLLNCQIQSVRVHSDVEITFSPQITLIGGPNESGKSTLVEALHRALFLKASATGTPVAALQSRVHLGQPIIQLSFEAKGDNWFLRKRFSGNTGQVNLRSESDGMQLSGPSAEDKLAELLGINEILGSTQAGNVLPTRWAHLWVRQGNSGDDLLKSGKPSYDFDQLRLQLERSGGAAVQQSAWDQSVELQIEEALDKNYTTKGTKKNSPLFLREQSFKAAKIELESAKDRLAEYESASEQLANICEELKQIETERLPALQENHKQLVKSADEITRLDGSIKLATQTLVPIQLRHSTAAQILQKLEGLIIEVNKRQLKLSDLQKSVADAENQEKELVNKKEQLLKGCELLIQQQQTLVKRQELLQRLVDKTSTTESLLRLEADLQKSNQAITDRKNVEQKLSELKNINKQTLQDLRSLEQQQRDACTRQEAMAAGVKVLKANQVVLLNGQTLEIGAEERLSSVFQLQVGNGVLLEISPGGGQALEDLDQIINSTNEKLAALLLNLGITNFKEAEELLEQRTLLEQELKKLNTDTSTNCEQLEAQKNGYEQRITMLDKELNDLACISLELEQEQPLPQGLSEIQEIQQQINISSKHSANSVMLAEKELKAAQLEVQENQLKKLNEANQLEIVLSELSDRKNQIAEVVREHGDQDTIIANVKILNQDLKEAVDKLNLLQIDRLARSTRDPELEQKNLEIKLFELEKSKSDLIDRRGRAKERCDGISSEDPFAVVEQKRLKEENSSADLHQLKRIIEAHKLLKQLFKEVQSDLQARYSEPLERAISDYLKSLSSTGSKVLLNYDQSNGFQELQLRRGDEFYDFGVLSGGMREQLAAALRLSMADVLKGAHDGCLPLVFDDAFANSDPERIEMIKRMLETAVERGLQIILLTCDPAAYGSFAQKVVELGGQ